ncbi:MAG: NTP transferase domain-containing protein [Treponema sp.]|jgi:GTP:adenosylcobinamide-phosphate guanylyltransferase|nr:NTP transferase domain-containing protein [Treponema sp.]
MNVEYIIVQAGGKGTRLNGFTRNKPKCLVPVNNLPILFHLFRQFPQKKFIIIGDYRYEVLEKYLEVFAEVSCRMVRAGKEGNCAGISGALKFVPDNTPFMLIWSDLILAPAITIDGIPEFNYLGISKDFECRWSFNGSTFEEKPSREYGVAGMFIFQNKKLLAETPESGEFVNFLSGGAVEFKCLGLEGTREIGGLTAYNNQGNTECRCRPFNRLEISGDTIMKIPIDAQGEKLAEREIAWYREVRKYKFEMIPEILSWEPFTMRRIRGCNIYRAKLDDAGKKTVIDNLVAALESLHSLKSIEKDILSIREAYYTKTIARLEKVRGLIPFADQETIIINNKPCRNIFFYKNEFSGMVERLLYNASFAFIHGDCTFSNLMTDDNLRVIFLDPRGYFGFTELYGDTAYDWAKVFYSLNGDYDQFNNGNFTLGIGDKAITLEIAPNGWKHLSDYYLAKIPDCSPERIRFIHAVIWLSLTAYTWEDYDSICGAFYNGLLLMDEFLREYKP